ncbi:MAG: dTDP-glucose 4,6-dehydratase [Thermoleophilaceae bacterium]|nr:dTDP-glucose 4,6-dehydratase [Thermoleophilaceae bacterium]
MPTCLITGGAGFLGSHLCDYLLGRGNRVICVDNFDTGSLHNIEHLKRDDFRFLLLDITQHFEIDEDVDFIYHMASPASPIDYARLPLHTLKVGAYGTHNTLGLAKLKRARFMIASTSEVYGDPLVHPQPETYWGNVNPIGPRGVYDEAKRYAEALTMAYLRQQGVDTAIARIFNSILADEQVLFDDGRELQRIEVSELAVRLGGRVAAAGYLPRERSRAGGAAVLEVDPSPAVEYPLAGFRVPAVGEGARSTAADATALIAHPPSGPCFEVRTRYGRSIRVTGDHSVFVEGEDGGLEARPVADLAPGDAIAVARRIEVPERDRSEVDMLDVWRHAEGDPWDLTLEAPGLGEMAWSRRRELFGLLVSERRNAGPNWRNGAWTKLIRMRQTDRLPLPVARRLGQPLPSEAKVRLRIAGRSVPLPAKIAISDELLWLLGLYVAEGCMHERPGRAFLTISGEDSILDRAAAVVERSFGLHVVRAKPSDGRSGAIFVHSKLLLRLFDFLGLDDNRKRIPGWILGLPLSRLKWFIEGYREGDGVHSGAKLIEAVRHEFSTIHDELKDDLIVAFARFGLVPSVGGYSSTFKARTGPRRYPFWRLTLANVHPWSPLEWDRGVSQRLNARTTGDVVWAAVTEIEEIEPTGLVYDFSVPGLENFWAGTGVVAHNTYGPRMRPNDGRAIPTFLQQALTDKPLTVFGDGSQTRSFCFVDDLVRGLVSLAESGVHEPVNIGNPDEMSLLEMAKLVVELTESRSEIVFEALPVDDPQVRQPDITRARDLLGWEPQVELRDGLRQTIDHAASDLKTPRTPI